MNLAVTLILLLYHVFSKLFWLGYKTLEKLHPDFESIKMNLLKTKRIDPKYYKELPTYEIEKDLLEKEWDDKVNEAKLIGISTHEYIRNLLITDPAQCQKDFSIPTLFYEVLQDLLTANDGIFVEYRLEHQLDDKFLLVGIPDYFLIQDGYIHIKDWKVSDDPIKFKSMYEVSTHSNRRLKHPISSLQDVNGVHYQLLLSIYMWMLLLLRPDLKPGSLEIVWIKDLKIKKIYPVEYLEKEVDKLLKWHIKNLRLQEEIAKCREILY